MDATVVKNGMLYTINLQKWENKQKKIGLKTGAKHLTNYNKSKAHSYEIKNRFKNISKEEKLKYGERLNYSRNLNYAKKNGFDSYEEFIQYRLNVAISLGFDNFEPLREKLRSCPNNLTFDEAVKFLEKREKEIEIKYKIFYEEFIKLTSKLNDKNIDSNSDKEGKSLIILEFSKDDVELKYKILKDYMENLNNSLNGNFKDFVIILYGSDKNIYYKKKNKKECNNLNYSCLTLGINSKFNYKNDCFMFMRLASRRRWCKTTLDPRNYKIKHDYFNYKIVIYYNCLNKDENDYFKNIEDLEIIEAFLAKKENAIYWRPSTSQKQKIKKFKNILSL